MLRIESTGSGNLFMKDEILNLLSERKFATFAELQKEIPDFAGTYSFEFSEERPNLIIWPTISVEAAVILSELLEDGRIYLHGALALDYAAQGWFAPYPIASANCRARKALRWIPMFVSKEPSHLGDESADG
jgi:hypothetical protein